MQAKEQVESQIIQPLENPVENPANKYGWLTPTQFKPGVSGNPNGRPKKPLSERLLARLLEDGSKETAHVVESLLSHAKSGNEKTASASVKAITEIFDRVEGKVPQALTGNDGGPLAMAIEIVHIGSANIIEAEADDISE